ncbi:MAG: GntR family transcriptional regulator [Chloroflexi bacterium]|nr:MAG: GntR family transcriptional regulator [Chloroflexota bacterium]
MAIDTSTRLNRVKDYLLNYISTSQLGRGDRLPSEAEMSKELGVSRNTIREAYITLEAEGIINRRHGVGTFVERSPMIKESLRDELLGFPQRIKMAGYTSDFRLLSVQNVIAPPKVYDALQVAPEQEVLRVEFLLLANDLPTVFLIDHFSPEVDHSKFDWDQFDGTMLNFISDSLEMPELQMHSRISAINASQEVAEQLQLEAGKPIIHIQSRVDSLDERPLTYTMVYLNPNYIEIDITRNFRHK